MRRIFVQLLINNHPVGEPVSAGILHQDHHLFATRTHIMASDDLRKLGLSGAFDLRIKVWEEDED